jgi:hypothetical protein
MLTPSITGCQRKLRKTELRIGNDDASFKAAGDADVDKIGKMEVPNPDVAMVANDATSLRISARVSGTKSVATICDNRKSQVDAMRAKTISRSGFYVNAKRTHSIAPAEKPKPIGRNTSAYSTKR